MSAKAAIILAAGQGTRMKSPVPKVLHKVGGRTMLDMAIDAVQALGCDKIVVVVGAHSPQVGDHVEKRLGPGSTAIQDPPLGTGHAVLAARAALGDFDGQVIITAADTPLMDAGAIRPLLDLAADIGVLGFEAADPFGYGRLVIEEGLLRAIIEEKEADTAQKAITACNSGVISAQAGLLFELLSRVTNDNAKGEFYLTDIIGLANMEGRSVRAAFAPEAAMMGVNSQGQLATAEGLWQQGRRAALMEAGVAMSAPDTVHLSHDTVIGPGAVIEPYVVFGPGVAIEGGATIRAFSHIEGAKVAAGAIVGPYSRLRPGAAIGEDAHIGNFVEVKAATIGKGAKANHLAYLGDGEVGAGANIGAGTIFCNYDGVFKHQTRVGAGAFVGSNSALVAPVTIGEGAYIGSGSVITRDVAPGSLALTRPDQVEKPGWVARFRTLMQARKDALKT
ncbi:MAG: UDP-N-acetylglucosamine diphosphorylase/glucosamine-phosphate N-acetyltransferase [Caulobacteraceae bacterium]|nr:UDP-N-acetylglucosamine diphosphorylase/glucosamine-phosphate N-acetyltransferase [Caulobacteraceae bacterium]